MRGFAVVLALAGCSNGSGGSDGGGDLAAPRDLAQAGDSAQAGDLAQGGGDGATSDTWANFGQAFFASYCTSCHSPTGTDPGPKDFTMYSSVLANAPEIRCGVAVTQDAAWMCAAFPPPKQFPVGTGPKPTDAERDRLVQWIGAGLPQ
jgi:hypothetical protein